MGWPLALGCARPRARSLGAPPGPSPCPCAPPGPSPCPGALSRSMLVRLEGPGGGVVWRRVNGMHVMDCYLCIGEHRGMLMTGRQEEVFCRGQYCRSVFVWAKNR